MAREKIPVVLRHDDGREHVITHVSRITSTAVSAAIGKAWDSVIAHTGEPIMFDRVKGTPGVIRCEYRAGPWALIAERSQAPSA